MSISQIAGRLEELSKNALPYMDQTVHDIFSMMLGMHANAIDTCEICGKDEQITAIVGFAGVLSGCCMVQMYEQTAMKITRNMLGAAVNEMNNQVKDAIGEVCNMIAGGWKNKLQGIAHECMLSVPTVVTGEKYDVYLSQNTVRYTRAYGFEGQCLNVTMLCEVRD